MDDFLGEIQAQPIYCPYCGKSIEIFIDPSIQSQEYIEDCQVCCRPITIRTEVDFTDSDYPSIIIQALHENEY